MKRPLLTTLALTVPLFAIGALAYPHPLTESTEPAREGSLDEGPIAEQMEVISAGMKRMRRALREEGQEAQCLEIVCEIEKAALYAKTFAPPMTETLPEGDRAKFIASYRKTMIVFLDDLLALETALIDGDKDTIKTAFQSVRGMEDKGHERFTEDG